MGGRSSPTTVPKTATKDKLTRPPVETSDPIKDAPPTSAQILAKPVGTDDAVSPGNKPVVPVNQSAPAQEAARIEEDSLGEFSARAGPVHVRLQKRFCTEGHKLDFRTPTEARISEGRAVDLVLIRDELRIACEISVTRHVRDEVKNVEKCVAEGFTIIAMVALSEEKLKRIEAAVVAELGPSVAALVTYYLPDRFSAYLQSLPRPAPLPQPVKIRRGYKVKVSAPDELSPEKAKARENATIDALADLMRKKPELPNP
jgi:hypothetical protein